MKYICLQAEMIYHHDKKDPQEVDEQEDLSDAEEGPGDGDGQDRGPDGRDGTPEHPHYYQQTLVKFEFSGNISNKKQLRRNLDFLFIIMGFGTGCNINIKLLVGRNLP